MHVFQSSLGSLTIPNGSNVSNVIDSKSASYDAESILIIAPATLDAGTYTIEVGNTQDNAAGTVFSTLQNEQATDYPVPAQGKAIVYSLPLWPCFRIKSSVNVAADRAFKVFKISRG